MYFSTLLCEQDTVNILKAEGYKFPTLKESDAMFSADTAPEWADGEVCHRYDVISIYNVQPCIDVKILFYFPQSILSTVYFSKNLNILIKCLKLYSAYMSYCRLFYLKCSLQLILLVYIPKLPV